MGENPRKRCDSCSAIERAPSLGRRLRSPAGGACSFSATRPRMRRTMTTKRQWCSTTRCTCTTHQTGRSRTLATSTAACRRDVRSTFDKWDLERFQGQAGLRRVHRTRLGPAATGRPPISGCHHARRTGRAGVRGRRKGVAVSAPLGAFPRLERRALGATSRTAT